MPSADEILISIERRLKEVRNEILSLEAARMALESGEVRRSGSRPTDAATVVPDRKESGSARPRAARKRPRAKSGSVLRSDGLEAVLRETSNGLSAAAIAQRTNARQAQVRDLLRELERKSQVRRTGVGRGTRWRIVTDEERIAERAAELARMSGAAS